MPLDPAAVAALTDRLRAEVEDGPLVSAQLALGLHGEIVHAECFGDTTPSTRYVMFSATKPFVAAAIWQVLAEGLLRTEDRVVEHLPFLGQDGPTAAEMATVTVEHVLLHTAGFPYAPLGPGRWETTEGRRAAMSRWRLSWTPGTRFEYHPTSAHWVLAELLAALTGRDHREVVHDRVTAPLGLPRLLGIAEGDQDDIAELRAVGSPATPDELEATFGVRELPGGEVTAETLLGFNDPTARAVGVPGGGGVARAVDVAGFYQALLHDPAGLWDPVMLRDVTGVVRNRLPDPLTGTPANRSLGLVLAGDDGRSNFRGMGRTVSPAAFGHNGAKGQLAFADPATGLSVAILTNGLDLHEVRQPRRDSALASLAGRCATA
ncbi:MAG: beta-lactamase family protein [Actinobacteria bacterium]|nr:beta-lactamase family protein [Actinomycetota bacterium]